MVAYHKQKVSKWYNIYKKLFSNNFSLLKKNFIPSLLLLFQYKCAFYLKISNNFTSYKTDKLYKYCYNLKLEVFMLFWRLLIRFGLDKSI